MRADVFWEKTDTICTSLATAKRNHFHNAYARVNAVTEVDVEDRKMTLLLAILLGRLRYDESAYISVMSAVEYDDDRGPYIEKNMAWRDSDTGLFVCAAKIAMAPVGIDSVRSMDLSLAVDVPGESMVGDYVLRTEVLMDTDMPELPGGEA